MTISEPLNQPKPTPSLAALEQAVEAAWQFWDFVCDDMGLHEDARDAKEKFVRATVAWLDARRAARDAGMVSVMVSREGLDMLRGWKAQADECHNANTQARETLTVLARDLAPWLKETP